MLIYGKRTVTLWRGENTKHILLNTVGTYAIKYDSGDVHDSIEREIISL
jgi:hypothetical protein